MASMSDIALLSEAVRITPLMVASGSAGGIASNAYYPASGSFLDMSGFGAIMFLIDLRDLADAIDVEVYQAPTASSGSAKAVTSASKTDILATDDGEMISIEVGADQLDLDGGFRYVSLKVSGVSGTNYIDIHALKFRAGLQPVTQPATYTHQIVLVE
jgi:hypothetical protein